MSKNKTHARRIKEENRERAETTHWHKKKGPTKVVTPNGANAFAQSECGCDSKSGVCGCYVEEEEFENE